MVFVANMSQSQEKTGDAQYLSTDVIHMILVDAPLPFENRTTNPPNQSGIDKWPAWSVEPLQNMAALKDPLALQKQPGVFSSFFRFFGGENLDGTFVLALVISFLNPGSQS